MKIVKNIFISLVVFSLIVTLIPINALAFDVSEIQMEETQPKGVQLEETEQEVQAEETQQEEVQPEETQSEEVQLEATQTEVTQPEVQDDDPGRERLAGNIPAEFYGPATVFSTRASYTHDERFDGYEIQKGIDVSKYQGSIDWEEVKAEGVQFAIIRVGARGSEQGMLSIDPYAIQNIEGATLAGIPIGVYIFSQAITEAEAIEEANYVLNIIKEYDIDLPVVMDYEYVGSDDGRLYVADLTKREATDNCLAFCKVVENAGYDAMVYANSSFLNNHLYADEISSKYEIWLARYNSYAGYEGDYSYWQYTSTGSVKGISGSVDMNFRYVYQGLKVSKETQDSVTLQWEKVDAASGYEILKKNSEDEFELIAQIEDAFVLEYSDMGLSQGTAYTYKIRPFYVNEAEEITYGDDSKEVTAVTGIDTTTTISGASSTFTSVKLTWKKAENVTGYQLQKYNSSAGAYQTIKNSTGVTYTDSGLDGNTTYKYRVRPYKTVGGKTVYGSYSAIKSVKTSSTATGVTSTKVNIRSGASTSKKVLKTVNKGTKLTLTGGTGNWYKISITVSGIKKTGYIVKSYVKIASIPAKPSVTAKGTAFDKVKLTWKKVSGASGYVVQRYNSSKKKYETVKTITSGSTVSYTNGSLNCSTTYKYRVRAYRSYYGTKVYGSYSSAVSAKTKASVKGKTTDRVNIRKGAGTSYKSYKIVKKGTRLTITGSKGSWYRVSITVSGKKKTGYVKKTYVKLI